MKETLIIDSWHRCLYHALGCLTLLKYSCPTHPFINILATALSSCILCEGEAWELPNWSLVLIMWILNASRRQWMAPGHWVAQAYTESFWGGKGSLCWGEKGLLWILPCTVSLESWAGLSKRTGLSGDPVFFGQECSCKHRRSLRWRWGSSRLPFCGSRCGCVRPQHPDWFIFFSGMSTGESWRRGSATLVTAFEEGGSPHGNSCSPYSLSFGLHFWTDCTLLSESLRRKWEISVSERNSSVVLSRAGNLWAGLLLNCIHPGWFHSWGSLTAIQIPRVQVPNFCRKCSRTIPWCCLKAWNFQRILFLSNARLTQTRSWIQEWDVTNTLQ